MTKRKSKTQDIERRKKLKSEQDAQLSTGVFGDISDNDEEEIGPNWDNEEQDYELKPRRVLKEKEMVESLPIKREDGTIERVMREVEKKDDEDDQEEESEEDEESEEESQLDGEKSNEDQEESEDEDAHLTPQERLVKTKEEIAELASKLIENPEENVACLTRLRKMSESRNFMTSQLAVMALIPIFKSLAPSYRIRPLTEMEKREKVSREVTRLRTFEQSLVVNYKAYIDLLSTHAKISYSNSENRKDKMTSEMLKRGNLAAKAAQELCLSSLRHFNYRVELFTIIIKRLNRKPTHPDDLAVFNKSIQVLDSLLQEDADRGDLSVDIIRIMTKSIKDKRFRVDEAVINVFLNASLLDDYDPNNNREAPKHVQKKDRVHLSKKQRKQRKETKAIEEEMKAAETSITVEQREKNQANVLKMILQTYLLVLQANEIPLLSCVLEGLTRFGIMSNLEMLGDYLQVLREIIANIFEEHEVEGGLFTEDELRTILLCISSSFQLVQIGQKIPFQIDLNFFVQSYFRVLTNCLGGQQVGKQLLICLDHIAKTQNKNRNSLNIAAIVKRVYTLLLQSPERSSILLIKYLGKLNRFDLGHLYTTEDKVVTGGSYKAEEAEIERCNIGAATIWENVLLDAHYCPAIKDGSRSLMKMYKSERS